MEVEKIIENTVNIVKSSDKDSNPTSNINVEVLKIFKFTTDDADHYISICEIEFLDGNIDKKIITAEIYQTDNLYWYVDCSNQVMMNYFTSAMVKYKELVYENVDWRMKWKA